MAAPYSYDSLDRFHNVTEMFLVIAANHHNIKEPEAFIGYWKLFRPVIGRSLNHLSQSNRMNRARVDWKHYGIEPSAAEIEKARTTVTSLLEDECPDLFGIDLNEVSLADFISHPEARALVSLAESNWNEGDVDEPFADLTEAFDLILDDYTNRKRISYKGSVFGSPVDMAFVRMHLQHGDRDRGRGLNPAPPQRAVRDFADKVIEALAHLDKTTMLIGLGVDFRRYGKFLSLTPEVEYGFNRQRWSRERVRKLPRSVEDYQFCREFVISTAIHLAQFDYDFDHVDAFARGMQLRRGRKAERAAEDQE